MSLTVIHNGMQIRAVCDDINTTFVVEYKAYSSRFSSRVNHTPFSMVVKRLKRELQHIRSNHMASITKADTEALLDTFQHIYKSTSYADNTESILSRSHAPAVH